MTPVLGAGFLLAKGSDPFYDVWCVFPFFPTFREEEIFASCTAVISPLRIFFTLKFFFSLLKPKVSVTNATSNKIKI